jgi:site-specific recombinase XerD
MQRVQLPHLGTVPKAIANSGRPIASVYVRFFSSDKCHPSTRRAYQAACDQFFDALIHSPTSIRDFSAADAKAYFATSLRSKSQSTKRLSLSALRSLFHAFLDAHVIATNPFVDVTLRRASTGRRTLDAQAVSREFKKLLAGIKTSSLIDYRDKALIAVLCLGFSPIDAALRLERADCLISDGRYWLRFAGRSRAFVELPCHPILSRNLRAYTRLLKLRPSDTLFEARPSESFRSSHPATRLSRVDAWRIVAKRVQIAGLSEINCRTLRSWGLTMLSDAVSRSWNRDHFSRKTSLWTALIRSRDSRPLSPAVVDDMPL